MMDKYQLIDAAINTLDQAAEARGIQRCSLLVETVRMLAALKDNLKEEDRANAEHDD